MTPFVQRVKCQGMLRKISRIFTYLPGTKKPPMPIRRTILGIFRIFHVSTWHKPPMEHCYETQGVFTWLLVFAELGSKKTLHGGVSQGRKATGRGDWTKATVSQTSLKRHIKSINKNWTEPSWLGATLVLSTMKHTFWLSTIAAMAVLEP